MQNDRDWSFIVSVTVRRYDGKLTTFGSLEEAVAFHRYGIPKLKGIRLGNVYVPVVESPWGRYYGDRCVNGDEIAFYDEMGLQIPLWKIQEVYQQLPPAPHWRHRRAKVFTYRDGPVPGIHGRRWRKGGGYRRPQTMAERRESHFIDSGFDEDVNELPIPFKVRSPRVKLPSAWDDIHYSHGYRSRSWKRYRRTQYR